MKKERCFIVYQITNKINNNIYIGCHVTENINDKYMGSGSNIKKAIKEFGKENFDKILLYNFNNEKEMLNKERELVNDEFIKRGDTYNILLGGGSVPCDFNSGFVVVKDLSGNTYQVHKTDPRYLSGEFVGITKGKILVKDENNNNFYVDKFDERFLNGELVGIASGFVVVKDKYNNKLQVNKTDPRFLSGELVGISKEKVTVRDKDDNIFKVSIYDERYLSGELVYFKKGRKISEQGRKNISEGKKGKYVGETSPRYGTCWIYNETLKENKTINKNEIDEWLNNGWKKGRKIIKFK